MRWLIPAALILSGCAGTEIVKEPVEVEVPIPVACIDPAEIPDAVPSASDSLTAESEPGEKIRQVLIERERLKGQNEQLRSLLIPCTQ